MDTVLHAPRLRAGTRLSFISFLRKVKRFPPRGRGHRPDRPVRGGVRLLHHLYERDRVPHRRVADAVGSRLFEPRHPAGAGNDPAHQRVRAPAHRRAVHPLRPVREPPALQLRRAPGLQLLAADLLSRGHGRHAEHPARHCRILRVPVFPVQLLPRQHRRGAILHRSRARPRRGHAGRPGQGRGHRQRAVRDDFRQFLGQRGGLRHVHHPDDDQDRILAALLRRRGIRGLHPAGR